LAILKLSVKEGMLECAKRFLAVAGDGEIEIRRVVRSENQSPASDGE
jgi:hypothetical protein